MAGNSMNTTQQLDSQSSFTRPQLRKLRPLPSRNSQTWRKPLKTPAPVPSAGIATPSSVAVVPVVDAAAVTTTAGNATSSKVKFEDTDFEEVVSKRNSTLFDSPNGNLADCPRLGAGLAFAAFRYQQPKDSDTNNLDKLNFHLNPLSAYIQTRNNETLSLMMMMTIPSRHYKMR